MNSATGIMQEVVKMAMKVLLNCGWYVMEGRVSVLEAFHRPSHMKLEVFCFDANSACRWDTHVLSA